MHYPLQLTRAALGALLLTALLATMPSRADARRRRTPKGPVGRLEALRKAVEENDRIYLTHIAARALDALEKHGTTPRRRTIVACLITHAQWRSARRYAALKRKWARRRAKHGPPSWRRRETHEQRAERLRGEHRHTVRRLKERRAMLEKCASGVATLGGNRPRKLATAAGYRQHIAAIDRRLRILDPQPTGKPTTSKPTTSKPTTSKPTTSKPTTSKPTTSKPTISKATATAPTTQPADPPLLAATPDDLRAIFAELRPPRRRWVLRTIIPPLVGGGLGGLAAGVGLISLVALLGPENDGTIKPIFIGAFGLGLSLALSSVSAISWAHPSYNLVIAGAAITAATALGGGLALGLGSERVRYFGGGLLLTVPLQLVYGILGWISASHHDSNQRGWRRWIGPKAKLKPVSWSARGGGGLGLSGRF